LPAINPGWPNTEPLPFNFVADDAFPLTEFCMKPHPQSSLTEEQRIFNYRLSRFRRISENTFGIWVNRFRVFTTRVGLTPDKETKITLASIALHNLLRTKSRESYTPYGFADSVDIDGNIQEGLWRENEQPAFMSSIPPTRSRNSAITALKIRESFKDYFCTQGSVPWQWGHIYIL